MHQYQRSQGRRPQRVIAGCFAVENQPDPLTLGFVIAMLLASLSYVLKSEQIVAPLTDNDLDLAEFDQLICSGFSS